MKIKRYFNEPHYITIEEFAEKHDLTMEVRERGFKYPNKDRYMRFYAEFSNTWVENDGLLRGTYGNGATEEEAIEAYAGIIQNETLIVDPHEKSRREIDVPTLYKWVRIEKEGDE